MTLSFRGRLVASRGDKLQRYGATWYHPFLSSWDRDQENSAFVGRVLFRQAYSTPPDLYRPRSEQAKRAGPNMTNEGHTNFVLGVVRWRHGTTHAPGTPPGGGRARAALPGSQRTARAQLVAD